MTKRYLLIPVVCLFVLLTSQIAYAANAIWVGDIKGLETKFIDDNTLLLTLRIDEDTRDGEFNRFEEDKIVHDYGNADRTEVKIILDGISAGAFAEKTYDLEGKISTMVIKNLVGSFVNPDLRVTLSDKEIFSAEFTFRSDKKLSVIRVPVDKTVTTRIQLNFKIRIEEDGEKVVPVANPNNVLELSVQDFSDPFPSNLTEVSGTIKQQMQALYNLTDEDFVTFVYPLRNMRPSSARTLMLKKLSPYGWMEVNDDHGLLLITDYVRYVRSIVEILPVYDLPIPQVELIAKVIEVTLTQDDTRGFTHTFKRDKADKTAIEVGSPFPDNFMGTTGITGSASHYSGDILKEFMVSLNLSVEKGSANILASPRTMVLNNQTSDFRVGETYHYLVGSNITDTKETTDLHRIVETFNIKTITTGVSLNVRPTILSGSFIECNVKLSYDEVTGYSGPNMFPVTATRSLSTVVRLRDGQTIVIGGLFREKDLTVKRKIPGLGDIPVVNYFFTSKQKTRIKTELVFILTINKVQ